MFRMLQIRTTLNLDIMSFIRQVFAVGPLYSTGSFCYFHYVMSSPCTCNHRRCLLVSMINSSCYLRHTLLSGDGAQGGTRVEVVEVEAQEAAAAELIHQQGLALLKHIWVQHGAQNRRGCRREEETRLKRLNN